MIIATYCRGNLTSVTIFPVRSSECPTAVRTIVDFGRNRHNGVRLTVKDDDDAIRSQDFLAFGETGHLEKRTIICRKTYLRDIEIHSSDLASPDDWILRLPRRMDEQWIVSLLKGPEALSWIHAMNLSQMHLQRLTPSST